jgi:hypothetical protein
MQMEDPPKDIPNPPPADFRLIVMILTEAEEQAIQ